MATTSAPLDRNGVRTIEHTWIPMRDGTRLAARVWLPADVDGNALVRPTPAILEYIPYRKRDMTRARDESMHPYFAAAGFASLRVDLRGSGDSEGILVDEYLPQELSDGEEIIAWIASQPWCDGNVGMIGISWGGFNGLQIAARRPPALKAVVSVCSTDDRYADDVHYMGGCLLGDNVSWASTMFAYNSMPPDPQLVGEKWREMWRKRLEGSGFWLENWLSHQHRDGFWKHGSICEDFAAVETPVMAVSGWADGYSNAVFRLLEHLRGPRLGIIGPWSHTYPHLGTPGPAIGFLQECVRFWKQWLCGEETGITEEPMLRAYMLDSVKPATDYRIRPGRWVSESAWPAPGRRWIVRRLVRGRLLAPESEGPESRQPDAGNLKPGAPEEAAPDSAVPEAASREVVSSEAASSEVPDITHSGVRTERVPSAETLTIQSPLSVGLFGGKWCSYASAPDLPYDQREEDGGSLVFDSEPLEAPFEILGAPVVDLEITSDQPVAMVAVRLTDVAPSGKGTRVTYGLLNLTHRSSHEHPEPLVPGRRERVRVRLNHVAQRFSEAHRIRLSVSTSYWPLAWPSPAPVRLDVHTAACALHLPSRPIDQDEAETAPVGFEPVVRSEGGGKSVIRTPEHNWLIVRDLAREKNELHVISDHGLYRIEDADLNVGRKTNEWYRYQGDDPTSAESEIVSVRELARGAWRIRTETRTLLRCTEEHFELHGSLDGFEGDVRVFSRTWNRRVPRKLL